MQRRMLIAGMAALLASSAGRSAAADAADGIKSVTVRASRDIGYFAGDLVKADVDLVVARDATLETASLPHPGPLTYWLDLKSIDAVQRGAGADRLVKLKIVYQEFYDALDARRMEIPTFAVFFRAGNGAFSIDIPAWSIGVSPLREVSPPPVDDPKDYMQPDRAAPEVEARRLWLGTLLAVLAALLSLLLLAWDRAWRPSGPVRACPRRCAAPDAQTDAPKRYRQRLSTSVAHSASGRRPSRRPPRDGRGCTVFLEQHPNFQPAETNLRGFFAASRTAFFGSNVTAARRDFPLEAIEAATRKMAAAELVRP